jgi:hypothetical protein
VDDRLQKQTTPTLLGTALLCVAGHRAIAIPIELVGQVVECQVMPLPLARQGVRGVALHEDRVLVALGFGAEQIPLQPRRARGVLLALPDSPVQFVLEVGSVGTLSRMTRAQVAQTQAFWVPAFDDRSRPHLWFDAATFVHSLLSPPAAKKAAS